MVTGLTIFLIGAGLIGTGLKVGSLSTCVLYVAVAYHVHGQQSS